MEVLCSLWRIIPRGGNTTSFDFGVPDRSGTGVVKSIVVDGVHQRIVVLSLDCSSSFDATTLVGVEDTDISVCVRSVGGSGLQITIPGPRAKERC